MLEFALRQERSAMWPFHSGDRELMEQDEIKCVGQRLFIGSFPLGYIAG
jgi:hypothetical protein